MRKSALLKGILLALIFSANSAKAQNQALEELGNLITDAIFLTGNYVSPAADASVYQAASSWVVTPKKKALWDFEMGLHFNTFFTPKSDRQFAISNSDFKFFSIQNATSGVTPTALGNRNYVTLVGTLDNNPVSLRTPEGINRETVMYPFLQGSLGLMLGTELIGRYSPRIYLKNVDFQVYGVGLKHSLSQYLKGLENRNLHFSTALIYSNEDMTVGFLDVQTSYGNLGLNSLNSKIDTWQLQFNGSKEFNRFELSAGFIMNRSNFVYKVNGPKGSIEEIIPLQDVLNKRLESIYTVKNNYIGEVAGRYKFYKLFLQTSVAFGKFVNTNIGIQYEF